MFESDYDDITETICATCGDAFADFELEAGMIDCFICETLNESEVN
jgi:hypothetical protein